MPGICKRCNQYVGAAEERLALGGHSFHMQCFNCAQCNKSLDSMNVTENRETQEIYCKTCYRDFFATQGYGYGQGKPALVTNTPPLEDCFDVTPTGSKTSLFDARARSKPKIDANYVPPPSWKGMTYWTKHPRVRLYGKQVVVAPRQLCRCTEAESYGSTIPPSAIVKSTPRPEPRRYGGYAAATASDCDYGNRIGRPVTSPAAAPVACPPRARTPAWGRPPVVAPAQQCASSNSACSSSCAMNPCCAKCGEPVFFNERRFGYHGVYHKSCFRCCCCRKTLDSMTVCESKGQLFCKGCYKREKAPEGVGFGVGAGVLQTH